MPFLGLEAGIEFSANMWSVIILTGFISKAQSKYFDKNIFRDDSNQPHLMTYDNLND
jgi:hypothetical protein